MRRTLRRARGFALILALFLIVSLSAIGAYLLTVSNVQVETGVMDEPAARAYPAARAGVEWGAYQVLRNANCPGGTTSIAMPFEVAGFHAEVTCTAFGPETEGGAAIRTYRVVSTGCNQASCSAAPVGPTSVNRQLQLTVAD
jgi:MSHA biogenesis protein MshP